MARPRTGELRRCGDGFSARITIDTRGVRRNRRKVVRLRARTMVGARAELDLLLQRLSAPGRQCKSAHVRARCTECGNSKPSSGLYVRCARCRTRRAAANAKLRAMRRGTRVRVCRYCVCGAPMFFCASRPKKYCGESCRVWATNFRRRWPHTGPVPREILCTEAALSRLFRSIRKGLSNVAKQ